MKRVFHFVMLNKAIKIAVTQIGSAKHRESIWFLYCLHQINLLRMGVPQDSVKNAHLHLMCTQDSELCHLSKVRHL